MVVASSEASTTFCEGAEVAKRRKVNSASSSPLVSASASAFGEGWGSASASGNVSSSVVSSGFAAAAAGAAAEGAVGGGGMMESRLDRRAFSFARRSASASAFSGSGLECRSEAES